MSMNLVLSHPKTRHQAWVRQTPTNITDQAIPLIEGNKQEDVLAVYEAWLMSLIPKNVSAYYRPVLVREVELHVEEIKAYMAQGYVWDWI